MWKHVSCPYVLKFDGVFYHNGLPAIVTPWMPHGNITEYLESHPDADRLRLVSLVALPAPSNWLTSHIRSLAFRRGQRNQVPPQLRCGAWGHQTRKLYYSRERYNPQLPWSQPNILISDSAPLRAVLADFGFMRVTTTSVKASSQQQGTLAFMAPELLLPDKFHLKKGVPSPEADIYALGMTVYQVLTGKWPFFPRREAEVVHAVVSGERPPKPENAEEIGITEVLWDLLRACWREDRTTRPAIAEVLNKFCEITGEGKTIDSTLGGYSAPRLTTGNRSPVISHSSSLAAIS